MTRVNAHDSTVSFTDFSERNTLRPAQTARSRTDVSRSLRSLRKFAVHFYTQTVVNLVDDAISFIDSYQGLFDSDSVGWKLMAFWITSKFSKFWSMIVSRDVDAARTAVLSALPRQGDKRLCMKAISVVGCPGDGNGNCFDSKRAHFQPNSFLKS
ncbi:hypothetical protein PHYSODRAFT_468101 [Phytophthora sojae]|uniref:Uncharacterized protein n=1 Tax=Phytophthora sojae (strain P6497) TaxID=1094619 RepID=G4YN66_PHYSP|nr:hypothetical protein PHYSODRAFT_468101 [Phytophthora sojae]EGZ30019.1 hypothetical protein PHYSODRAFT_468101 [Phytophthora sojae]|eukprot:XP_009517294.1 hypothetical protein PHYSODRAFT_468101 [Phytophthora sojae]